MTQTFMDTGLFQVVITIAIAVSLIGIISCIYNIIYCRRMKENPAAKNLQRFSMLTAGIFIIAILTIIAILFMNLNENKSVGTQQHIPEVATAKELAGII